jgi:hypothetical protein
MKMLSAWLFLVLCLLVMQAGASVVTSIPGGIVVAMPAVNYSGAGPQTFGTLDPITWSSTNASNQGGSLFGFTGTYHFGPTGAWTGALGPMAGLNDSTDIWGTTDTMTFTFAQPVSAVGGFLNYYIYGSTSTTIAVWDSSWNLIDTYDLSFTTNGNNNTGAFYGFVETSSKIKYFTLTDNYIGIVGLTYAGVPEPSSLLLMASGLLGAAAYGRKRMGL